MVFARKRTNDLWAKYAEKIRRDIQTNQIEPTEFIIDLAGAIPVPVTKIVS